MTTDRVLKQVTDIVEPLKEYVEMLEDIDRDLILASLLLEVQQIVNFYNQDEESIEATRQDALAIEVFKSIHRVQCNDN